MATKSTASSEAIRQKGNDLYRNGKIAEAVMFYTRASELAPTERAPWTNLSAAYFELGEYTKARSACETALSLLEPSDEDYDVIKQKHVLRKLKSCLFAGCYGELTVTIAASSSLSGLDNVLPTCAELYANATRLVVDPVKARNEIILKLPRYKPTLTNTAEYYTIGHDDPESLYDEALAFSPRKTLSFLFGGIGDARNMFQTIIKIAEQEQRPARMDSPKFYHFTMVDIKPAAIARDLVILLLLDDLSKIADNSDKAKNSNLLLCLLYTYMSSIMPSALHEILQEKIAQASKALTQGKLPSYIEIPSMYRLEILHYLEEWQSKVQREYPITRLQPQIIRTRIQDEQEQMPYGGSASFMRLPPGINLAKEQRFERETGAIMLPSPQNKLLDPDLQKAFNASDVKSAVNSIKKTWSTNVTLVDLAWQRDREPDPFMDIDVGQNPFMFCNKIIEAGFKPHGARSFFDYAAPWFVNIAQAMRRLRGSMRIEACVGDVIAVLEQIKHGAVGHRKQARALAAPNEVLATQDLYPQMYDRIHLSNVPDYVGGTLTSHMYALQLIHPGQHSYVTSTCLRNPPRFDTVAEFDAEYVALHAEKDLEKVFHVRMKPNYDEHMPMCAYNRWHHSVISRKYADLMPRGKLESWLYRLFFKISIPLERRRIVDNELVYSPLNLTFFFRLCEHLHSIGYPAHWLSDVISTILSGTVTTTARPSRSEPLKPREIDAARKPITQSLAPFTAELSTLAAMWQVLLPFGILSNEMPPLDTIKEYSVFFKNFSGDTIAYPVFILVFYKDPLPIGVKYNLRSALLSDERRSDDCNMFREQHIHIISAWSWNRSARTATFWLREDIMQKMRNEQWQVCMYRTDNWRPQSNAYDFSSSKVETCGESWVQRVNAEPVMQSK